ncbi:uncharacterized protein PFL1_03037 [Pseudozyma flocculosa PF-1]|uniref:Uncharacterized protein n=1 Tax=Pseudozyma flocculosa PF-1 TaxID=1277687 RepID=A0A061H8Q3_9BASI|nr:uncharacterized protein PFL1_03037 [Pseudozyma flocculosa PF-1]EPQ29282.1 hypothetical protein PFL1_03037 [Pseudozyma flocculosa PF-1]
MMRSLLSLSLLLALSTSMQVQAKHHGFSSSHTTYHYPSSPGSGYPAVTQSKGGMGLGGIFAGSLAGAAGGTLGVLAVKDGYNALVHPHPSAAGGGGEKSEGGAGGGEKKEGAATTTNTNANTNNGEAATTKVVYVPTMPGPVVYYVQPGIGSGGAAALPLAYPQAQVAPPVYNPAPVYAYGQAPAVHPYGQTFPASQAPAPISGSGGGAAGYTAPASVPGQGAPPNNFYRRALAQRAGADVVHPAAADDDEEKKEEGKVDDEVKQEAVASS